MGSAVVLSVTDVRTTIRTLQRFMAFLVVAVPVLGIASRAAETRALLYPTALSGLVAALDEHGDG